MDDVRGKIDELGRSRSGAIVARIAVAYSAAVIAAPAWLIALALLFRLLGL